MPVFTSSELVALGTRVFVGAGAPEPIARRVAQSLTLSNLVGVDSHGIIRILEYLDEIKAGNIIPTAEPTILRDNGIMVMIDGQFGFGQIVAEKAMRLCTTMAGKSGIGVVSIAHVMHIGRVGEWAALAAEAGMLGLVFANGGRHAGWVAPFGSRQRILGTNPIAFAIPAGKRPAVVSDFATSVVAEGKVRVAHQVGAPIPPGWVIDKNGRPTTNPADLYDGGALQVFGGHKGFGLSLLADLLAGILSGANTPIFPDYWRVQNAVFMLALDVKYFRPDDYDEAIETLLSAVKDATPAEGVREVLLPGEPELRYKAEREQNGIPVDDKTWAALTQAAATVGVSL